MLESPGTDTNRVIIERRPETERAWFGVRYQLDLDVRS